MNPRVLSLSGQLEPSGWLAGRSIRPATVLQIALLLLLTGNVGHIPALNLGDRQAPLHINDFGVAAILCVGALATLRAQSLRLSRTALAAVVFIAIGALSAVAAIPRFGLTPGEVLASLAYLARWTVYFGIYVVTINCVRANEVGRTWRALEWMMLAFAAFGVIQSIFLPDFAQMVYPESQLYYDWDPQGHRLMSTVLEPNIAAAMILTVLLVQMGQVAAGARIAMWKPGLLLVSLVMTLSRSGVVAFAVGMMVILFVNRGIRKRMLGFFGLAAVIALAGLPLLLPFAQRYQKLGFSDSSALARLVTLQRAAILFVENFWFGIGFNTFGFVMEHRGVDRLGGAAYSSEGGLLFVAVMTGVFGLAAFCAMVWFAVRKCQAVWRDAGASVEERGLCIGTAAATAAVCVHSVFVNSLMTPFVMEPLWVLWGLTFVLATQRAASTRESSA